MPYNNGTVASSIWRKLSDSGTSYLEPIYRHLPEAFRPHRAAAPTYFDRIVPRPVLEYIADPAFISAICLPVVLIIFSMSSGWGRRFWPGGNGGRYSPFGPSHATGPPTVTDDDYHYLGPDDIVDAPRGGHRNESYGFPASGIQRSAVNASRADSANPLSPDILVLKHRGTTYPLHFPAFTIAEGKVGVSELRRLAARETRCEDPRRIKLLYKGRILKDDAKACKDEGLKQNSEIMCIVSEGPIGGGSELDSSESPDEEDPYENGGPRVEVDGTIRHPEPKPKRKGHRGGRRRKGRDSGASSPVTARDSGFLDPEPLQATGRSRSPSPMRPCPATPTSQSSAPPKPPPTTAAGKLEDISSTFHHDFVPKVADFIDRPPSDKKTRDFEYKKLSEGILAQVILKLDAVETEGDEELRFKRRQLVKETQRVLSELDEVGKGKSI